MASWFKCDCGQNIPTNVFSGSGVRFVVAEEHLESDLSQASPKELARALVLDSPQLLACGACGRLHVFDVKGLSPARTYVPAGAPALNLVVLRCSDIEQSRRFYAALGLSLRDEQHGDGPKHYSVTLGGVVLELYPSDGSPSTGVRLGLALSATHAAIHEALALGGKVVRRSGAAESKSRVVLRDPDGHVLDIALLA